MHTSPFEEPLAIIPHGAKVISSASQSSSLPHDLARPIQSPLSEHANTRPCRLDNPQPKADGYFFNGLFGNRIHHWRPEPVPREGQHEV
jgi:hypothetical protein